MTDRFHVTTGGPGSGKTSLITALAADGFRHMPEAGRAIIQDQVDIEGTALPWRDREAFAALMLAWEMRSYREALAGSVSVLFDRGVPDVIGYLRLCGLPVPPSVIRAAKQRRYATKVFIAPHWPAIFVQDAERKQSNITRRKPHTMRWWKLIRGSDTSLFRYLLLQSRTVPDLFRLASGHELRANAVS